MSLELDGPAAAKGAFAEAPGVTMPSAPEGRSGLLSEVIAELGYASQEAVDAAVEQGRMAAKQPEVILVETGAITEEQLARAAAEQNGVPYVDLAQFPLDEGAQQLIGADMARRYRAAPIGFDFDGSLIVALTDPLDPLAVSDIGVITKSEVLPAVSTPTAIDALVASWLTHQVRMAPEPQEGELEAEVLDLEESGTWKPEPIGEPELVIEQEPAPEPEPVAEPDPILEVPPIAEPEAAAERVALEPLPEIDEIFAPIPDDEPVAEAPAALESEPAFEPEPAAEPEPVVEVEPEPVVEVEPEPEAPVEPEPVVEVEPEPDPQPEPQVPVNAPAALDGASPALQRRIMDLVSTALDDVAVSEIERLEAELAKERGSRVELERTHEDERAARELAATELEHANAQIEELGARVDKLERKTRELKEQRDRYKAERDELRSAVAEAESASERERELADKAERRVRERVAKANASSDGLQRSLAELEDAIAGARRAADEVASAHRELGTD